MRVPVIAGLGLSTASIVIGSALANESHSCLPVIDLGYELHQALSYNKTTDVYLFQNIRYAQAPVGPLRFRAPVPPEVDRQAIKNGSETRTCPQGIPLWQEKASVLIPKFSDPRVPFNLSEWEKAIATASDPGINFNADSTEDCLFLDVHVSKSILNEVKKKSPSFDGAPVLVWIHGGGYTLGSKTGGSAAAYYPDGLLSHAEANGGMVFVALNYRLGAVGFLGGSEVEADGDVNAGLLDQRLALRWVQENIHLFGGSANRVTIMGESAGGGSALLHASSLDDGAKPFTQIIVQSPALPEAQAPDGVLADFLAGLNVSTLAEARNVNSAAIIRANEAQIAAAPATSYIYAPVYDGLFLSSTLEKQLSKIHDINILAGHNSFEGGFFFDPTVKTEDNFRAWLSRSVIGLNETQRDYITNILYPAQFDGSFGYVDQSSRQMALWGEAVILSTFQSAAGEPVSGRKYAYEFNVPPGFHLQDLTYTFNDPSKPVPFPLAQDSLQHAIVNFVQKGVPVLDGAKPFPEWGHGQTVVSITSNGTEIGSNNINETRCSWWQSI